MLILKNVAAVIIKGWVLINSTKGSCKGDSTFYQYSNVNFNKAKLISSLKFFVILSANL